MIRCYCCNKKFTPQTPDQKMCNDCFLYRGPHYNVEKPKPKTKTLSFAEISHIGDVYYKIHNKYLHYGDLVNLIDSNPCKCVCCGAAVSKNKHLCKKCENKVVNKI